MKFKDSFVEYIENIKNNPNITSTPKNIKKIEPGDSKISNSILDLYNIINHLFPYNILEEEKEEKEILKNIIDNIEKDTIKSEMIDSKEEINDLIEFENSSYLVVDVVNYNNSKYLYMINNEDFDHDTAIVKKIDNKFEIIKDDEEFKHVVYELILDFKDRVLDLI